MQTNLTQQYELAIYNSGSEFVIKTLMEQYNEIETLKTLLQAEEKKIEIEKILSDLNLDIDNLLDDEISNAIKRLLQIIENLNEENIKLRREIEYLKNIRKKTPAVGEISDQKDDRSSEKERKSNP